MHGFRWLVVVAAALLCLARGSLAQDASAFTRRITEQLRTEDPEAAALFERANAAREAEQHAEAERLYRATLERAPGFVHARRRLSGVVHAQGRRPEAIVLARECVATARSPENRANLASVLTLTTEESPPSPAEMEEALELARGLVQDRGADPELVLIAGHVALAVNDLPLLQRSVERLERALPEHVGTHFFAMFLALSRGDLALARAHLAEAQRLGLPEEQVAAYGAAIDGAQPWPLRWLPVAGWIAGAWTAVFLGLLLLGSSLSRATLRASARAPAQASGEPVGAEQGLRRAYRAVLWLSCGFYYVSVPLVLAAVVALAGAIGYGFLALGRIPILLVLFLGVLAAVTVWVGLKSLLVASRDEDPGTRLDLLRHPRLRALLDEVAGRIGTRAVDSVYLTPGTELAVMERGGLRGQLGGTSERCLILGLGVLEGFPLGPFRSVLAHEYGHFSNRDTAGGGFALAVRRSLVTMAHGLAEGGAAAVYNPAWLFLNGFHRVFLRISQGASRLQEVMADRWSAFAYGSRDFERGLRHVIERSLRFAAEADREIRRAVEQSTPLDNLYEPRDAAEPDPPLTEELRAALEAEPSPYDSHPAPKDRLAWVAALAVPSGSAPDAEQPVWSLFDDPVALQREMTRVVRADVARAHGVTIPG
ncbi:MAG TPA: M48 family metalloprotease [Planctomycetota bacterium]